MRMQHIPIAGPVKDPIDALLGHDGAGVLAVITGVEGPSYRPVGAMMALFADGERTGTLSSGCIEADLAIHAEQALSEGRPISVRYGQGSPFMDIQLPCGGGLDILLVPRPDAGVLGQILDLRARREPLTLAIETETGAITLEPDGTSGWDGNIFRLRETPAIRFLVFGKGPEAATFASLVQGAGYPNLLLSPDPETLEEGANAGCETRSVSRALYPDDLAADPWTAIILFFHDHEWEPPILADALKTPAFYVGSQGSRRARDARVMELQAMGVAGADLDRLRGPVGLIPSARDAGTLAVSVLAEILQVAMERPG
jgi:xanthine dehydrogenase accessory factor